MFRCPNGVTEATVRSSTPAWMLVCLVWALVGCGDDDGRPGGSPGVDRDRDGFARGVDCDDNDGDVHPGADERVNCQDDNCDGQRDEGTSNFDRDRDGFCPSTGDRFGCEGDAQRYPGRAEDGGDGSGKANRIDDNCNGVVDEGLPGSDIDKDGFTVAAGDCNDSDRFINPGAIEVEGRSCRRAGDCPVGRCVEGYCRCAKDDDCSSLDACIDDSQCHGGERCRKHRCRGSWRCMSAVAGMGASSMKVCRDNSDNDCDGKVDEMPSGCDDPKRLSQSEPRDYARAVDLCDAGRRCGPTKRCGGSLRCVGGRCRRLLSAAFNVNGDSRARAIVQAFAEDGPIHPRANESMIVLSTGLARYDPAEVCPEEGTDFKVTGDVDPDPAISDRRANDLTRLTLELVVPSNAHSFAFDFQFFTAEYPNYLGSEFNDTFWVALSSKRFTGNISFDRNKRPIRLNNALFDVCDPDPDQPETSKLCTKPASVLTGTGFAKDCSSRCPGGQSCGGATGWLTTTAPVVPGEKISLSFAIFDKGDGIIDSTVVIDNFRWRLTPATRPVTAPH